MKRGCFRAVPVTVFFVWIITICTLVQASFNSYRHGLDTWGRAEEAIEDNNAMEDNDGRSDIDLQQAVSALLFHTSSQTIPVELLFRRVLLHSSLNGERCKRWQPFQAITCCRRLGRCILPQKSYNLATVCRSTPRRRPGRRPVPTIGSYLTRCIRFTDPPTKVL